MKNIEKDSYFPGIFLPPTRRKERGGRKFPRGEGKKHEKGEKKEKKEMEEEGKEERGRHREKKTAKNVGRSSESRGGGWLPGSEGGRAVGAFVHPFHPFTCILRGSRRRRCAARSCGALDDRGVFLIWEEYRVRFVVWCGTVLEEKIQESGARACVSG